MSFVGSNILAGASGQGGGGYEIERSLRFNSGDSSRLTRTFSAGNRKVFTISLWAKKSQIGSTYEDLFGCDVGGQFRFIWEPNGNLEVYSNNGSITTFHIDTVALFKDPSAWYHFVISVDAINTSVKFYVNGVELTNFVVHTAVQNADTIVNSAALHTIGSKGVGNYLNGYLADVHFIDGQALAATNFGETDDNGVWQPIKYVGTYGTNGFYLDFKDTSSSAALGTDTSGMNNTWTVNNLLNVGSPSVSTSAITNVSAGTQASWGISSWNSHGSGVYYSSSGANQTISWSGATANVSYLRVVCSHMDCDSMTITGDVQNGPHTFTRTGIVNSGYGVAVKVTQASGSVTLSITNIAGQCNLIIPPGQPNHNSNYASGAYDNVAAVPTTLTTTNNNNYSSLSVGDLNANGNSITAINSSTPSISVAGGSWSNGNVFTKAGLVPDALRDSPTNGTQIDTGVGGEVVGNYATLNPLNAKAYNTSSLSDGNLKLSATAANGFIDAQSTIAASAFDCYCEVDVTAGGSNALQGIGVGDINAHIATGAGSYVTYRSSGAIILYPGNSTIGTVASYTTGDVIGMTATSTQVAFYKNGSLQGTYNHLLTGDFFVCGMSYHNGNTSHLNFNFGQSAFIHAAPSNYKCLCTTNLPDATIEDGSKYFDTVLWSGNGGGAVTVPGLNLNNAPGLVWSKTRNHAYHNNLWDIVRGFGSVNALMSDLNYAEGGANGGTLNSATSSSLTFSGGVWHNENNKTYVAWNWDAGSSNTTIPAGTAVTNQAQTWSSNITTTGNSGNWWPSFPATYIFDADTSNYGHPNGYGGACVVTLSFSPYITCGESVSFLGGLDTNAVGVSIAINGGTPVACTAGSSSTTKTTVSFSGSISSITLTKTASGGGGLKCYGFEVDGTRLVDGTAFNSTPSPSIGSTVRANPSAGFSIVSYTNGNGTVKHGLSAPPELIITKRRDAAYTWGVYSKPTTKDAYLALNLTSASGAVAGMWGSAEPTSSVFGTTFYVAPVGSSMIAYCFAPVEGYSAMGSYEGNGSADGPFIYTGFKPSWIMIKNVDNVGAGYDWFIFDNKRDTYNTSDAILKANLADAESDSDSVDMVSNGFKIRATTNGINLNAHTHIYLAYAERPFKKTRAR